MTDIILASQSPRRKDLLTQMGVAYTAIPSNFDEQLDDSRQPEDVAIGLALGKALAVAKNHPDALVIGSDTIVTIEGAQLEKPRSIEEAHHMLRRLSGKSNEVSTGVAVVRLSDGTRLVGADTTKVSFRPYDLAAATRYVDSGDPMDKAGGYGIQSGAAPLISHIEGQYDTIVGLPTKLLAQLLSKAGVNAKFVELTPPVESR